MFGAQVAMAFADSACVCSLVERSPMIVDERAAEGVDRRELVFAKSVTDEILVLCDVLDDVAPDRQG